MVVNVGSLEVLPMLRCEHGGEKSFAGTKSVEGRRGTACDAWDIRSDYD